MRLTKVLIVLMLFMATAAIAAQKNVYATLQGNSNYSTLVKAINAAGLQDEFKTGGPYTVFAPTNAAFDKIPRRTLASLLMPENKAKLRGILTYHAAKGRVTAGEAMKMKSPTMIRVMNGQTIRLAHTRNKVTVDNATVVSPDIMASNGVIHGIDTVLMPK